MGSVYAGLLAKAGHEVCAIDTWQEHIDTIATSGLSVSGASGSFVVDSLHVGHAPRDAGTCDVWVIAHQVLNPLTRWRRRSHRRSSPALWSWRSRTGSERASGWRATSRRSTS